MTISGNSFILKIQYSIAQSLPSEVSESRHELDHTPVQNILMAIYMYVHECDMQSIFKVFIELIMAVFNVLLHAKYLHT